MSESVLTSVLFTDLVDSTAIGTRLGPERNEELRRTHFAILREVIDGTDGVEVKNLGDGLMVTYASPSRALESATAMQKAIARHNYRAEEPLYLRMGLSVGEAFVEDGDYFGEPVVEAARLCGVAEGEQILTTGVVKAMAGRRSNVEFRDVGERELKGLPDPVITFEVLWSVPDATDGVPLPGMLVPADHDSVFGFVGRADEIGQIEQLHKEAIGESSIRTLLIGGEAGIGKTAMVALAAAKAHDSGAIVLLGHSDEQVAAPYQMWTQALTHLVEHSPSVADTLPQVHRTALARLLPTFGDVATPSDTDSDRFVLMNAVEALLAEAMFRSPMVLVLDDLHWADSASLHVLRHVLSGRRDMPLLVLGTYRHTDLSTDHPLTALLADLHRLPGVKRVQLSGLDDRETVELVESATGHEIDEQSMAFVHAVRRDTNGNPFFTRELLRHVGESNVAIESNGRWVLPADGNSTSLPASIRDVVTRRVTRLGEGASRLLSVAAVLGREFDLDELADLAEVDVDDLLDLLDAASAAAIVSERADIAGAYRFAHALTQRTLYENLSGARRARLHERAAHVLESASSPPKAADIAHHLVAAVRSTDTDRALHYVTKAAHEALAALAPHDAIGWYHQAFELANGTDDAANRLRAELLIGLGTAQRYIGNGDYRSSLLEATALARRLGDDGLLINAILAADRRIAGTSAADDDWVAASEAALQAIGTEDSVARARLLSILSQSIHAREWERRRELSIEAIAIARRLDDRETLVAVLPVAYQHYLPEEFEERLALTAEAVALAADGDDAIATCNALYHRIDACMQTGAIEEADQRIEQLAAEVAVTGLPMSRWQLHMVTSVRALLAGDLVRAEADAGAAFEAGSSGGQAEAPLVFGTQLLEIRRHQGRLDEMAPLLLDSAFTNAHVPGFRQVLGCVLAELGRYDEARAELDFDRLAGFTSVARDAAWLMLMTTCATTASETGDVDSCEILYELLSPFEGCVVTVYAMNGGAVERYLGRLAHAVGHYDVAEGHLRSALARHEDLGAPYWMARTQLDLVDTLRASGRPEGLQKADELAESARAAAHRHGYGALAARSEQLGHSSRHPTFDIER